MFTQGHRSSVKSRFRKKPLNYAAFLGHFPSLVAVRSIVSLNQKAQSFARSLANLETLGVILPSPLLTASKAKPPIIRKLVLHHHSTPSDRYHLKPSAIAQMIQPLAPNVKEVWLHVEAGTSGWGNGRRPKRLSSGLLDCAERVKWKELHTVGLVISPDA